MPAALSDPVTGFTSCVSLSVCVCVSCDVMVHQQKDHQTLSLSLTLISLSLSDLIEVWTLWSAQPDFETQSQAVYKVVQKTKSMVMELHLQRILMPIILCQSIQRSGHSRKTA